MKKSKFLSLAMFSVLTFSMFAAPVFAPQYGTQKIPILNMDIGELLGVPAEYVQWPNVLYLLLLPYFSTLAIIIGLFEEIGIFRRAKHTTELYIIIAAGWAFMLIPTGFLGSIAAFMYTLGAMLSVIIFAGVFVIGVLLWGHSRIGSGWAREMWAGEMGWTEAKQQKYEKGMNKVAELRQKAQEKYDQIDVTKRNWTKTKIAEQMAEVKKLRDRADIIEKRARATKNID